MCIGLLKSKASLIILMYEINKFWLPPVYLHHKPLHFRHQIDDEINK